MQIQRFNDRTRRLLRPHAGATALLLGLQLVMGFVALACGGLLIVDGLGMPTSVLDGTPFDSFLVPGLLLGLVVGGSLLLAARLLWYRHRWGAPASLAASGLLLAWIVMESLLVHDGRALQAFVFGYAVVLVALAWRHWHATTTTGDPHTN